jgi:hypothetical protein
MDFEISRGYGKTTHYWVPHLFSWCFISKTEEHVREQSVIIEKQQAKITELTDSMQQMQEMMMALLKQGKAPQNIPVPETPPPRGQSLRFATSTP